MSASHSNQLWAWCSALALCVNSSACLDTGVNVASAEVYVAGQTDTPITARDGWQVTLEEARVAFGPLWLCAGTTAGELCDVARAEWLDAVVVNALERDDKRVGQLWGNEGEIRSWMYDYGLVSRLTESEPYQTEAAATLGGNSVRIKGCATNQVQRVCFSLQLPVAQGTAAEQGVPVVRVSGNGQPLARFGDVRRMTAVFNAAQWLETVDFTRLVTECDPECAMVELAAESQAGRAVRSALEGTARPRLTWKRWARRGQ